MNKISQSINALMFVCGIGALSQTYETLKSPEEKCRFLVNTFGYGWVVLLREYERDKKQSFIDGLVSVQYFNEEKSKLQRNVRAMKKGEPLE